MEQGERALAPIEERRIDFYGDEILVVLVKAGGEQQIYVPIRQFCKYLGLDWSAQYRRIRRDEVLSQCLTNILIVHHMQRYNTLCLPLEYLPSWLFGVMPGRVKPHLAAKLQCYQEECFRVLWQAFGQGRFQRDIALQSISTQDFPSSLAGVKERIYQARKRAMQVGLPATLTVEQWLRTLEHFGWKCAYCRQRPGIIIEHFIPLSCAGSGTTVGNCVPACYACNSKKRNSHPDDVTGISREVLDSVKLSLNILSG